MSTFRSLFIPRKQPLPCGAFRRRNGPLYVAAHKSGGLRHIFAPMRLLRQVLGAGVFAAANCRKRPRVSLRNDLSGGQRPSPKRTRKTCLSNRKRAVTFVRW